MRINIINYKSISALVQIMLLSCAVSCTKEQTPSQNFPSTEEEWNTSLSLASSVAKSINSIYDANGFYNGVADTKAIISSLEAIEGVKHVSVSNDEEFLVLEQEDGVHYCIPYKYSGLEIAPEGETKTTQTDQGVVKVQLNREGEIITPSNTEKRAILIMPFYDDTATNLPIRPISADYEKIGSQLHSVGYSLDVLINDGASDINLWKPKNLSQYDLIIFATHGGVELPDINGNVEGNVALCTRIPIKATELSLFNKALLWLTGDTPHLAFSKQRYLTWEDEDGKFPFNNSIVLAMACHSLDAKDLGNYFLDRGCASYTGVKNSINVWDMDEAIEVFVDCLTRGASVQAATSVVDNLFRVEQILPVFWKEPAEIVSEIHSTGYVNLINPTPFNLTSEVNEEEVTLSWEMPRTRGSFAFDVYCDGELIEEDLTTTSVSIKVSEYGEHTWYVVSRLELDWEIPHDELYKSETPGFITVEPEIPIIVIPSEYDMYYTLPGIHQGCCVYNSDWQDEVWGISFKTSFKVTTCVLDDDSISGEIVPFYGSYPDNDGLYDNSVMVYLDSPVAMFENCGKYGNAQGVRPQEPIPSRTVNLCVLLPGQEDEGVSKPVASITQIGMPCISMKTYRISDVSIPYDVSMEGKFHLDFEVSYPDELSKAICKELGFIWSAKERYVVENPAMNYYSVANGDIYKMPLNSTNVDLDFLQFPLESRTFLWNVDMCIYTVYGVIYATSPATINHTF